MQRWRGVEAVPADWGRSAVTIGVFDGVHRGHQAVIAKTVETARRDKLRSVVTTFDPHPMAVLRPDLAPAMLTSLDRRAELIAELGVDGLCVLPFTREFSRLSPEEFVRELLVRRLRAARVGVGENFRFGHKAAGDVTLLAKLGREHGFAVEAATLDGSDAGEFSSSRARRLLEDGDVAVAAEVLGRPHRVEGPVVRGHDRGGSRLGFPTANIGFAPGAAIPADGVYAGRLTRADGASLPAAVSVGSNPTFADAERSVEAHVVDFSGDLYDEPVGVDFVAWLREQRVYAELDPLIAQIAADVEQARAVLGV